MRDVLIFGTLGKAASESRKDLAALPEEVRWLEVRVDLAGDFPRTANAFQGRMLYTLRSRAQGGAFDGSPEERRRHLQWAARHYDLVSLEPADLARGDHLEVPPGKRLVTWHGEAATTDDLLAVFGQLSRVEARMYRLVTTAEESGDELVPLALLRALGRSDVVAYAEGPTGSWSRVLGAYLGAPAVFGCVEEVPRGQNGFSVGQLVGDYGLPTVRKVEQLFGIVGGEVGRSLSPRLHNAAYRALDLPALYLPFSVPTFEDFWKRVAESRLLHEWGLPLAGFSLAAPHKEAALAAAESRSLIAGRAGAANIMARGERGWGADTADVEGVLLPLRSRGVEVTGRRVAVLGCGGSGRAAAAVLAQEGAQVSIVNRTEERGRRAAEALGVEFVPLANLRPEDFSIVVNATPAGKEGEEPPFSVGRLSDEAVVIDFAYGAKPSQMVAAVRARGGIGVEGREVLYYQMRRQFQFMTGREMPEELVSRLLGVEMPRVN